MKTLFKPILAAFTAIILCVSMMGCDGVEKASSAIGISQKEGVPDGSGIATFRFPKGVKEVGVTYASTTEADKFLPHFKEELTNAGMKIVSVGRAGSDVGITVDVLKEDVVAKLNTTGIVLLKPYKRSGPAFQWIPIEGFVPIK